MRMNSIIHSADETRTTKVLPACLLWWLLTIIPVAAQNFWQQTNGPYGGDIRAFVINSTGHIFAGASGGGVFRSMDNGESWRPVNVGLPHTAFVQSLAINLNGDIFVGIIGAGISRSTDNGNSWTPVNAGLTNPDVRELVIHSNGDVFAGTNGAGVFRSADNGNSWTPVNNGLMDMFIRAFAINESGHVFAGTLGGGIFRTTDNGSNWKAINTGLTNRRVPDLAINSSGQIFAGTNAGGIFRSTDNGESWMAINNGLTNAPIQALAINASGQIFAGTNGDGIFRSIDNGESWMAVNNGLAVMIVRALVVNANGHIFAGAGSGGIFRSTDNGESWRQVNSGMIATDVRTLAIRASGEIFAGASSAGVFRSQDNGGNWLPVNAGLTNSIARALGISQALAINTREQLFNGTAGAGVFRLSADDTIWTLINTGLTNKFVNALAINAKGHIFAGTDGGVFRTMDDGSNWTAGNTGLTNNRVLSLAIGSNGHIFAGTNGGVFSSVDNGNNWTPVNNGLTNATIRALAINSNGQIFAGTGGGGVFRSIDNGNNWMPSNNGLANMVIFSLAINSSGHIFAGIPGGVFRSIDNGDNWILANSGLTNEDVRAFTFDESGHIFAGTNGAGVFRSVRSTLATAIFRSPGRMVFTAVEGGANPPPQTLQITNSAAGILNWSVRDEQPWLSLFPTNGTSTGDLDSVIVRVNVEGMSAGAYNATITTSDTAAANSPQTTSVTLAVASKAPNVTTTLATNLNSTSATLNGAVNPNGLGTTVRFQYGTTTNYGSEVPATPTPLTGLNAISVSAALRNLLPNTLFHYRVVATNSAGTTKGTDATFTTSPAFNRSPVVVNAIPNQILLSRGPSFILALNTSPVVFNDPDGDAIIYTANSSSPDLAAITISGSRLTVIPLRGGVAVITITADDSKGGTASTMFTVAVNRSPVVANVISNLTLTVGGLSFTRDLDVSPRLFSDLDGDALAYSVNSTAPNVTQAGISGNSILLVVPIAIGKATITLTANDERGGAVSTTISVQVVAANRSPSLTNLIPNQVLTVGGSSYIRNLNDSPEIFSDADGDTLSYLARSSASTIVTTGIAGSTLTTVPVAVGSATIMITANDGKGGSTSTNFNVTVGTIPNQSPVVATAIAGQVLTIGGLSFIRDLNASPAIFSDPDGDALTYTANSSVPSTAIVIISGSKLTVVSRLVGSTKIMVTAYDSKGGAVFFNFTATVLPIAGNQRPTVMNAIPDTTLSIGGRAFNRDLNVSPAVFSDPDGDPLTYTTNSSASNIATASILNSRLAITQVAVGMTMIKITANDGKGGIESTSFTATVTENRPPVVANPISNLTLTIGALPYTRDLSALFAVFIEPDGDPLSYSTSSSNSSIATAKVLGRVLTVSASASGNALITVSASDQFGGAAAMTFTAHVNRPPSVVNPDPLTNIKLNRGSTNFSRDLSNSPLVFVDADGDELSYSAISLHDSIAIAEVSENILTITPVTTGSTKITVEAKDKNGGKADLIVNVAVREPLIPSAISVPTFFSPQSEDRDIVIDATIIDSADVTDAALHYRKGGERNFQQINLNRMDRSSFRGVIPRNDVTSSGLEYYIQATNAEGIEARKPLSGVYAIRVEIARGETQREALPNGSEQTSYRLISVPLDLKDKTPQAVLVDDLGDYKKNQWRFHELLPNQSYIEYPNTSNMEPGKAFWLIVRESGKRINTGTGSSIRTDTVFSIPLHPSWNFVGNPFHFIIPLRNIHLKSTGRSPVFRTYEGAWNDPINNPIDEMNRFQGYAVFNPPGASDTLFINSNLTDTTGVFSKKLYASQEQGLQWAIRIRALSQEARDVDNFAAVIAGAAASWDEMDEPEPPVIGQYISVYFFSQQQNGKIPNFKYCLDARPEPSDGDVWQLGINTNIHDKVILDFDGIESVPEKFEVWLIDEALKVTQNLRQINSYSMVSIGSEHPKYLKLIVGESDFIAKKLANNQFIPDTYVLSQNFPNPFNPMTTIRYGLPQAKKVTLTIYNLLGEEVIKLLDHEPKKAGYHLAIWDGRKQDGRLAASGLYFYRFRTGSFVLTKKMALVK